jgi:hypothetical protein
LGKRNFEMGISTDDDVLLDATQARFEQIWRGGECANCRLRAVCPAPLDLPRTEPRASPANNPRASRKVAPIAPRRVPRGQR